MGRDGTGWDGWMHVHGCTTSKIRVDAKMPFLDMMTVHVLSYILLIEWAG
jgi:hypothetical protein